MINWLHAPLSPEITRYVECYWFIEKQPGVEGHAFPKLNPDPSAHLVLSPPTQRYRYETEQRVFEGEGSHWLFPHLHTFELDHRDPFVHIGIKFHAGALYSLTLLEYVHPTLDVITPVTLSSVMEHVSDAEDMLITLARNSPTQTCEQLDALLLPWLKKSREDQHSEVTRKALQLLDTMSVSALGDALYCSQRTLERSFSRVTGLTLKQCQSMNKLEAMLAYLYQREATEIDWSDVALKFGFSDQPHLIRHLKKQIGLTPNTYAKERSLTIDVYGGVKYS
ncbi:helix-turn-helix domain-containing protein [Enterovibrio norvegicus]|uniref:helix-turn-helix domain-containing protein n=1 Tax=Enterovibrio norvegicus TaxID=188144 RepID=UPI000C82AEBB|nr:AraC family transcriptional regulator [Enterovibrio norvegicus]PMN72175.1 AraC family transcriptional regulator [Enterovibrio norvegicus]